MCIQLGTGSRGHRRLSWRARPSLRGTASGRLSTASGSSTNRRPSSTRQYRPMATDGYEDEYREERRWHEIAIAIVVGTSTTMTMTMTEASLWRAQR